MSKASYWWKRSVCAHVGVGGVGVCRSVSTCRCQQLERPRIQGQLVDRLSV